MSDRGIRRADSTPCELPRLTPGETRVEAWEPVPGDADGLVAGLGLMTGLLTGLAVGSAVGQVAIVAAAGAVAGAAAGAIAEARDRRPGDRDRTGPAGGEGPR